MTTSNNTAPPDGGEAQNPAPDGASSTPAAADAGHQTESELREAIARRDKALGRARNAEAERDALRAQLEKLTPHADAWRQHQTKARLDEVARGIAEEHRDAFVEILRAQATAEGIDLVDGEAKAIEAIAAKTLERFPGFKAKPQPAPQPGINWSIKQEAKNRLLG